MFEDAPQVIAKVAGHLGGTSLDRLQRCRQFEPSDRVNRPPMEHRHQVLVDFAATLVNRRRAQPDARCGVPIRVQRLEAPLVAMHVGKRFRLAFGPPRMNRVDAASDELPRCCMRRSRLRQTNLRERAERLQALDALQPELVAPQLRAVRLNEEKQATAVDNLVGALGRLRGLDLQSSEHLRRYLCTCVPPNIPPADGD